MPEAADSAPPLWSVFTPPLASITEVVRNYV